MTTPIFAESNSTQSIDKALTTHAAWGYQPEAEIFVLNDYAMPNLPKP